MSWWCPTPPRTASRTRCTWRSPRAGPSWPRRWRRCASSRSAASASRWCGPTTRTTWPRRSARCSTTPRRAAGSRRRRAPTRRRSRWTSRRGARPRSTRGRARPRGEGPRARRRPGVGAGGRRAGRTLRRAHAPDGAPRRRARLRDPLHGRPPVPARRVVLRAGHGQQRGREPQRRARRRGAAPRHPARPRQPRAHPPVLVSAVLRAAGRRLRLDRARGPAGRGGGADPGRDLPHVGAARKLDGPGADQPARAGPARAVRLGARLGARRARRRRARRRDRAARAPRALHRLARVAGQVAGVRRRLPHRRRVHGAGGGDGRLGGHGGVRHAGGAAVRLRHGAGPARQPLADRLDRRHGPRARAVAAARRVARGRRRRLARGPRRRRHRAAAAGPGRAGAPGAGAGARRAGAAPDRAEHHDQSPRLHAAAARRPRRRDAARRLARARGVAGARPRAHRRRRRLLPAPGPDRGPRRAAGRHQDLRSRDPRRAGADDARAARGGDVSAWRSDGARIFVTALLVYVAFWNPWLQFSNSDNFVDGAVSLVDTGRWELVHWRLYEGKDTATSRAGRVVPGVPFGTSLVIAPVYAVWRVAGGAPVEGWTGLETVNAVVVLLLCAPAMALTAVQVAWLAGWLGASRRGRVLAALLFALGTQAFQFGTMLTKESLTALAVTTAARLALDDRGATRRVAAGALAGAAVLLTHSAALLAPLLALVVLARDGARDAAAFVLGGLPLVAVLGAYDAWLFGAPWRT